MALRSGSLVLGSIIGCLWFGLSTCTFYSVFSDKYFPCDQAGQCPYGNCVCLDQSVCVPPDSQGDYTDCWPCETVADCDDGDPDTNDLCTPEGICQNLVVTDPVCLKPLATVQSLVGGMGQSITANESFVYLGLSEGFHGIQIVDVSDPAEFLLRGVFDTDSDPANLGVSRSDVLGLDVSGSYLYLATYQGGLVILDVSNPDEPLYQGGLRLGSENWSVQAVGDLVYLARHGALEIIDVSDRSNPLSISSVSLQGRTQDLHVVGQLAYVASWDRFQVVDVSDPAEPLLLSDLDAFEMAYEVWASEEGYAYLALKVPKKLTVVDATDPENPAVCHVSEEGEQEYRGIDGWGKKIFIATGTDGSTAGAVRVYDIQDPARPVFESETPADSPVFEVKVLAGKVYAALVNGSLATYQIKLDCP